MKKKQAIEGKRLNAFLVDPDELVIEEDKDSPLYDERVELAVDPKRVKNVIKFGVLEPVLVRKDGEKVVVVDGRQRVKWARAANKILDDQGAEKLLVPCMVKRGEDSDMMGVMISANEQREEDNILVKAKKTQRFLDIGRTIEDASLAFGVTTTCINNWLKLLDLAPPVRKAVEEGRLSASAAAPLATLARDEQEAKLKGLLTSGQGKVTTKRTKVAAGNGRTVHPGLRRIKKVADVLSGTPAQVLGWVLGEISDSELAQALPATRKVFDKA